VLADILCLLYLFLIDRVLHHLRTPFVAGHVSRDEKLLVRRQVILSRGLIPGCPPPRGAVVHQMVPGSHELLGGDHPGLGELGLLQQGREVLGHLQALGLDVVEDVLHRHVPRKYVLVGELLSFLMFLFSQKFHLLLKIKGPRKLYLKI
jgi:hypothetical protein